MFEIRRLGDEVHLRGRFDASRVDEARKVLDEIHRSTTIDCRELEYISSAGLGALFAVQKRLAGSAGTLKIVHLSPMLWEIFRIANFHTWLDVEPPGEVR